MVTIRCPHCEELVEIDLEEVTGGEAECPECFELIESLDELADMDSEDTADPDEEIVEVDLALDGELDGRLGGDLDQD